MSLLHIILTGSSGVIDLNRKIDAEVMKLTKYCITFTNSTASASAGELINVDLFGGGILDGFIASNRTASSTYFPLGNNIGDTATLQDTSITFKPLNDIRQNFEYKITDKTGAPLSAYTSIQLWFEYF